jgi:hypothetical protein
VNNDHTIVGSGHRMRTSGSVVDSSVFIREFEKFYHRIGLEYAYDRGGSCGCCLCSPPRPPIFVGRCIVDYDLGGEVYVVILVK